MFCKLPKLVLVCYVSYINIARLAFLSSDCYVQYDFGANPTTEIYHVTECEAQCDMLCPLCYVSCQREQLRTQTMTLPLIFPVDISSPHKKNNLLPNSALLPVLAFNSR